MQVMCYIVVLLSYIGEGIIEAVE